MSSLPELREMVNLRRAEVKVAKDEYNVALSALDMAEGHATDCEEAQKIIQLVAQTVQAQAHDRIAGVVSRCLETVFDEPYTFKIIFEQKRGRTEARLVFERDGLEVDPMTASGGGVVDVAAFALRLSCLILSRPPVRRLLVLDEPFKFVSAGYRHKVRAMLEGLAAELKVQIIQVTHIKELECGTVIELQ